MGRAFVRVQFVLLVMTLGLGSANAAPPPPCMDQNSEIPVDNREVLTWKDSTPNQFLARAHVAGAILKVYAQQNGHDHFEISLGQQAGETLEVIYNKGFGSLPVLQAGSQVEVCGDFINSNEATSQYPASPDGAIIHWVHKSYSKKHASGFVMVDGALYGWN